MERKSESNQRQAKDLQVMPTEVRADQAIAGCVFNFVRA
jgi:hypothetical protein